MLKSNVVRHCRCVTSKVSFLHSGVHKRLFLAQNCQDDFRTQHVLRSSQNIAVDRLSDRAAVDLHRTTTTLAVCGALCCVILSQSGATAAEDLSLHDGYAVASVQLNSPKVQPASAPVVGRSVTASSSADKDDVASSFWYPLLLSTLAGLSTCIGAVIAVSFLPDEASLAFLLGSAIGVMATVSAMELWWHTAAEQHNFVGITAAVACGAALFAALDAVIAKPPKEKANSPSSSCHGACDQQQQQLLPNLAHVHTAAADDGPVGAAIPAGMGVVGAAAVQQPGMIQASALATPDSSNSFDGTDVVSMDRLLLAISAEGDSLTSSTCRTGSSTSSSSNSSSSSRDSSSSSIGSTSSTFNSSSNTCSDLQSQCQPALSSTVPPSQQSSLMRLGLLMAVTLTLHNLPEGVSVAFSALTSIGPVVALAIALHNIPEGVVIAAPIYAATNSKVQALMAATVSGLSEPMGALAALLLLKPFVTGVDQLDYVLAATGGVMLAVCTLELWPEGRRCGQDKHMAAGVALGTAVMAWTLHVGV